MRVTQMNAFPEGAPRGSRTPQYRISSQTSSINSTEGKLKSFLSKLNTDDYILAGIIIVLVLEGCDDYILLAALGYLFIMGLDIKV